MRERWGGEREEKIEMEGESDRVIYLRGRLVRVAAATLGDGRDVLVLVLDGLDHVLHGLAGESWPRSGPRPVGAQGPAPSSREQQACRGDTQGDRAFIQLVLKMHSVKGLKASKKKTIEQRQCKRNDEAKRAVGVGGGDVVVVGLGRRVTCWIWRICRTCRT